MPRMILVMPKGGMSGKTRKCYVVRQKLQVLEECRWLRRDHKLSLCNAATELGIVHLLLIKWSAKVLMLVAAQRMIWKSIFDGTGGPNTMLKFYYYRQAKRGFATDNVP
jgi:hypothetical protein